MWATRCIALAALTALLPAPAAGAKVYQDPTGTGNTDGGVAALPTDNTPVVLNIFLDDGNGASLSGTICEDAPGDESCGGDIELRATGLAEIVSIANPPVGDVVSNQIDPTRAKANWLDAIGPDTSPKFLLIATVRASGAGTIEADGFNVKASLAGQAINTTLLASTPASADRDGDGVPDVDDNCPDVANGPGEALGAPTWGNQEFSRQFPSIGCACLCGDASRDCLISVIDSPLAALAGLPTQPRQCTGTPDSCLLDTDCTPPATCVNTGVYDNPPLPGGAPLFDDAFCDLNADGVCSVLDSPIMATLGLPTQPFVCQGTTDICFTDAGCTAPVRCVSTGVYDNPVPPGGAKVAPDGCCGYQGLELGCP